MYRRNELILAALLVALTAGSASAAVTIGAGQKLVAVGDSITANDYPCVPTAGVCASGSIVGQINAGLTVTPAASRAILASGTPAVLASGTRATVAPATVHPTISYVNSGIAGNESSDIAANVTGRITQYNPDVVLLLIGINDELNGVPDATYQANVDSILTQTTTALPHVQILILSLLTFGEQWTTGPPLGWANCGSIDARIAAANGILVTEAAKFGATYVDARSQILTWLSTNNAPAPGVCNGPWAGGGPHPTIPTSELVLDTFIMPAITVVP